MSSLHLFLREFENLFVIFSQVWELLISIRGESFCIIDPDYSSVSQSSVLLFPNDDVVILHVDQDDTLLPHQHRGQGL